MVNRMEPWCNVPGRFRGNGGFCLSAALGIAFGVFLREIAEKSYAFRQFIASFVNDMSAKNMPLRGAREAQEAYV